MTHPEQPSAVPEPSRGPVGRVVVLIPTYNERENLPRIVARLRAAVPAADVLVPDDSSPDGTGAVADALAAEDDAVHVLHRREQGGARRRLPRRLRLGAGPRATTRWSRWTPTARTSPSSCRGCWRPSTDADVVLGSRWVPGGEVVNWPLHRKVLSVGGNLYTRVLLGMPVGDATGGYRAYRAAALEGAGPARRRLAGLLLPGRPRLARRAPGADGRARCRSRSSSGRSATPR